MKATLKLTIFPLVVLLVAFNIGSVQKKIVVIDAAHGGQDTGVSFDSILEKDIVLKISEYLGKRSTDNVEFITLRNNDEYIPLNERIERIKELKPDLIISLHLSQDVDVRKKGAVAHIYDNGYETQSRSYAESILKNLATDSFAINKEVKISDFYLIKNINSSPAVLLELGYLSNEEDRNLINDPTADQKIADSMVNALTQIN